MSSETATVEVLTAEVRVLMVGSRQVTLSVAKQLDHAKRHDMIPFGRVRLGAGRPLLIGREVLTGALVLAEPHESENAPYLASDHMPGYHAAVLCNYYRNRFPQWMRLPVIPNGQEVSVAVDIIEWCGIHEHLSHMPGEDKCDGWHWTPAGESAATERVSEWQQSKALEESDVALPLIVLAGLR